MTRKKTIRKILDTVPYMGYNKKAITEILQEVPSATPQEPILDKIRAEIEQFANTHCSGDDINIYDVFQIIDKYKESEGKDADSY